jgi:hypothetical protein
MISRPEVVDWRYWLSSNMIEWLIMQLSLFLLSCLVSICSRKKEFFVQKLIVFLHKIISDGVAYFVYLRLPVLEHLFDAVFRGRVVRALG